LIVLVKECIDSKLSLCSNKLRSVVLQKLTNTTRVVIAASANPIGTTTNKNKTRIRRKDEKRANNIVNLNSKPKLIKKCENEYKLIKNGAEQICPSIFNLSSL